MSCDVLNLEWSSSGRDREVATMICYALRKRGYSVVEANVFNYKHHIVKHNPRLLYAADPKGARINYLAVKFAHKLGIPVVTFTAEGDYTPEKVEKMFWGHVLDKQLIEKLNLQWSSRARRMILELEPSLANRIKVAGAVGFDRYQIYRFYSQEDWMRKYDLDYSRMVGYAGWGFDKLYGNGRATGLSQQEQLYGKEQVERFRRERLSVNEILRKLIGQNKQVLFILKEHPGVVDSAKTELVGLRGYPNTLFIRNEEAVADCINGCDIWMAFESTTCLEAWLLKKPTVLINPSGGSFVRSSIHKGSPILQTYEQVQRALDSCYDSGIIPEFEAKQETRRQIVEQTIQWADGKNHMRAAYLFEQILAEATREGVRIDLLDRIEALWQNTLFEGSRFLPFLPKFRGYAPAHGRFQQSELEKLVQRYEPYLDLFHRQNPLTEQDIGQLEEINL